MHILCMLVILYLLWNNDEKFRKIFQNAVTFYLTKNHFLSKLIYTVSFLLYIFSHTFLFDPFFKNLRLKFFL